MNKIETLIDSLGDRFGSISLNELYLCGYDDKTNYAVFVAREAKRAITCTSCMHQKEDYVHEGFGKTVEEALEDLIKLTFPR